MKTTTRSNYQARIARSEEVDDRPVLEVYRNNVYATPENELVTSLMIPMKAR